MDAKRLPSLVILSAIALTLIGCQPPQEKASLIIDDQNSQFAGKGCYGQSLKGRYLLTWSDGSVSLFKGSRQQVAELEQQYSPNKKQILMIEQDREISLRNLKINSAIRTQSPTISSGVYWQVWGQEDIQAQDLWNQGIKGEGVTVAVIDTGIDLTHPSLSDNISVNGGEIPNNRIDDDGNGLVDDYQGFDFAHKIPTAPAADHGTHVAGIIVAEPRNSPMVGVSHRAKILPLNIMSENGGGSLSAAVFAIQYAKQQGVKVINASWGGALCADTLKNTIKSLADHDILFVSAAGNDGVDIDVYPEFPAGFALPNQITVGASVQSGLMAAFSNYSHNKVHVLAPGHQILSSVPGGWLPASGTSMAAPFVSGLAALLWSKHPEATLAQIKKAITTSINTPKEYTPVVAGGRINAPLALAMLEALLNEKE
ncbi:MAG: hypothetical protein RJB66_2397 [Pseudomonadota bacterium]|jgi:subtilisin family serine protease